MNKRECCRAVFTVLEGAHDENGAALKISEITRKRIESACSIIGKMAEGGEIELMRVAASSTGLAIVLECDDELSMENGRSHPFFYLIGKFDKFSFSKAKDDRLRITMTMDKLWVS